ncbi:hypothetical protein L211DRAFT_852518 [Terfezia boudieri ATCC MYA-4762]|uniref:BTB domain-containing protein n=1 Tax=Terfezia boudieri ATCC MYA-4762 TaxID=1051890 RepID=A0A3N4LQJ6_9PEZI|nr:hypothetical protein L211DRAFT_852518 [Terfezia boudieri ATCC MYA-4762]
MPVLPTGLKHVLSSPVLSPAGPPPTKRSRVSVPFAVSSPLRIKRAPANSAAKAAGFPEFPDGDVEIILPYGKRYVLHRAILSMNSKFFRATLGDNGGVNGASEKKGSKRKRAEDIYTGESSNIRYRFRIKGKGQDAVLVLQDASSRDDPDSGLPPPNSGSKTLSPNSQEEEFIEPPSSTCFNCGITIEDHTFGSLDRCPGCEQLHPADASGFDVFTQNAYENLFLIYYNFTPTYIYQTKTPSEQCFFRLVEVAQKYGSLRAVSTRLDHDLIALGDTLWLHIFWDSLSWLALSLQIRSQAIFKEATIHIIGRGLIISHLAKLQSINIPQKVITMMQLKYNQVVRLGHITERQLRALNYPGDPTPYNHTSGDSTNWLALSLWRSFDSDYSARVFGRDQSAISTGMELPELSAEYFRLYYTSGEAYLGEAELYNFLVQSGYFKQLDDVSSGMPGESAASAFRRDVMMLKEYAREIAEPICTNESRLGIKELERRGGGYLTCITWKEEEMPWWGEDEAW